tara:strand:+ start:2486 stop:2899 length:414 start_codon:yes stop_codon:yes gene_type:complete
MQISKKRLLEIINEELLNEVEPTAPNDSVQKLARDIERFQNSANPMLRAARDIFNKAGDDVTRHGLRRNEMIIADLYYALFATRQRLNALAEAPQAEEPEAVKEPSSLPPTDLEKWEKDIGGPSGGLEIDENQLLEV